MLLIYITVLTALTTVASSLEAPSKGDVAGAAGAAGGMDVDLNKGKGKGDDLDFVAGTAELAPGVTTGPLDPGAGAVLGVVCLGMKNRAALGSAGHCGSASGCRCDEGEGGCDADDQCKDGLRCQSFYGWHYGYGLTLGVCVREEGRPSIMADGTEFEGDIDIITTQDGINQIVRAYGISTADMVLQEFPQAYVPGAAVTVHDPDFVLSRTDLIRQPDPEVWAPGVKVKSGIRGGGGRRRLGAMDDPTKLWPDATMYYKIDSTVSDNVKTVIENAMNEWTSNTCVKFVECGSPCGRDAVVKFTQPSSAVCSSAVGMDGDEQTIKLHPACGFGAAVHEIAHAFGFWHEQSRPDRDSYVTINWANIQEGKEHNFNKKSGSDHDSLGSSYDYGSIMHYSKTAFSTGGDTIVPKVEGVTIGQRSGVSDHDAWQMSKLYSCSSCPSGYSEKTDYYGTAPFCAGSCPSNWLEIGRHKSGDGSTCWFGTKAHCKSCCKSVAATEYRWYGTAPFCSGSCPSGWTYVSRSKSGDGARCWTGWKHYCRRSTYVDQCVEPSDDVGDCPPGGELVQWFGTAPFCSSTNQCPYGWDYIQKSRTGDGSRCWWGYKWQCSKSC